MTAEATPETATANGALTTFPASLSDCYSCDWQFLIDGGPWDPQVATHTIATILLIIDDSINITSTSTISASRFSSESYPWVEQFVSGTVATTEFDGAKVFLCDFNLSIFCDYCSHDQRTYPTAYDIFWAFSRNEYYPERVTSLDTL